MHRCINNAKRLCKPADGLSAIRKKKKKKEKTFLSFSLAVDRLSHTPVSWHCPGQLPPRTIYSYLQNEWRSRPRCPADVLTRWRGVTSKNMIDLCREHVTHGQNDMTVCFLFSIRQILNVRKKGDIDWESRG